MLEKLLLNKYNEINWYSYIITCEISKDLNRSLRFTKNYLKSKPYDYEAWFYLGIIYQRMDNHLEAIEAFDYSICIKEDYIPSYITKQNHYLKLDIIKKL